MNKGIIVKSFSMLRLLSSWNLQRRWETMWKPTLCFRPLLAAVIFIACLYPNSSYGQFTLRFEAQPGELPGTVEATVVLENADEVEGWSVSVASIGTCTITQATVPVGFPNLPFLFEQTEVVPEGAVSTVLFLDPLALPLDGNQIWNFVVGNGDESCLSMVAAPVGQTNQRMTVRNVSGSFSMQPVGAGMQYICPDGTPVQVPDIDALGNCGASVMPGYTVQGAALDVTLSLTGTGADDVAVFTCGYGQAP